MSRTAAGRLEGKSAFVTGAGSGLGKSISEKFAAEGARVVVTDIDEATAQKVAESCAGLTEGAIALHCDVSDSASVRRAFAAADEAVGELDILVNNAGIIHRDPEYIEALREQQAAQMAEIMAGEGVSTHFDTIERLTDEMFDRMMKVHMYGTFYCTREALPRMRAHGRGGRIVNMASIMGTASLLGVPDYCAAKGAILAFTRATARESASYGVQVNAIAPGFIDTPLLDPFDADQRALLAAQTPLGRLGVDHEIADAALFLVGSESTFLTGQVISPNGGIYMSQ